MARAQVVHGWPAGPLREAVLRKMGGSRSEKGRGRRPDAFRSQKRDGLRGWDSRRTTGKLIAVGFVWFALFAATNFANIANSNRGIQKLRGDERGYARMFSKFPIRVPPVDPCEWSWGMKPSRTASQFVGCVARRVPPSSDVGLRVSSARGGKASINFAGMNADMRGCFQNLPSAFLLLIPANGLGE